MGHLICLLVLSSLCLSEFVSHQATYQCGIRKHGFLPLIGKGWPVEEGHWPWHTAVFHRLNADDPFKYGCGGTLVNERHVLTAAHCAVRLPSGLSRSSHPAVMYEIELHFGQHNLSKVSDSVVIRDVIKAHVHPEYAKHKNDIAVLVTRLPVEYSDTVIPICLDQNVDRDLRELEGQRGWITGWGRTENGTFSDILQTTSLPVVSYRQCIMDDPVLFAPVLSENDFCAGNKNGTSSGPGDSGGGMYISDGDRWILRGIVSYGKIDNLKVGVNSDKYTVFVNVQPYLPWIKAIFAESEPRRDRGQKRISELECERFQSLAIKRRNGDCLNNRYRYNVILINSDGKPICNGALVEESHVITTCSCVRIRNKGVVYRNAKVRIEAYGIVAISEMICHPKHVHHRKHYDLAIIKLNATVSLCNTLIPACLANNWTENLYDILVKTLFQTERIGSADHMSLYESDDNRIKPYEACKSLHQHAWFNRSDDQLGELCVNSSDRLMNKKYSKLVDRASSGALLQTFNRNSCRSTIVGLKVHTERAHVPPIPHGIEIYARISYHLDWIENIIWRSEEHIKLPILGLDDKCNSSQHRTQITGKEMSVAIFHRNPETNAFELTCSGALISVKHVLTTARCVVNQTTGGSLPENTFELHFGLNRLSERSVNEQVRYASEVHIHQNYSVHHLAILVTSWPVRITPYVSFSCFMNNSDYLNAEYIYSSITGWSTIENGVPNDELKNNFLYINGKKPLAKSLFQSQKCSKAGLKLLPNQYCFHHANGINTSIADRGSGMRCFVNQSSILVGIVSSEVKGNDATSYTLLLYVQPYIAWINGIMVTKNPKRVSEKECERFRSLTKKINGVCKNYWDSTFEYPPNIVTLYDDDQNFICLGVLVRENRILTSCQCIRHPHRPTKAEISSHDVVDILKMICHPDYDTINFYHDVGVVELAAPVELSSRLIPACLANIGIENLRDAMLQTTLFKNKNWKTPWPKSSYEYVGTVDECDQAMPSHYKDKLFKPSQTCVINPRFITKKFNGSVVQSVDNRACSFTVIGIGSTAVDNPDRSPRDTVGIVHRVSYYLDWIEQVVWEEEFPAQQDWTLLQKVSPKGRRGKMVSRGMTENQQYRGEKALALKVYPSKVQDNGYGAVHDHWMVNRSLEIPQSYQFKKMWKRKSLLTGFV